MSFRKRKNDDSDVDSDEERLPIHKDDEEDPIQKDAPATKRSKNIWSDMLMEEQLLEKGQRIHLDRFTTKQSNAKRGPEAYAMPFDECSKKNNPNHRKEELVIEPKPVVVVTPADDDLFGDAPEPLTEHFGVKKNEVKVPLATDEPAGWWGKKGQAKRFADTTRDADWEEREKERRIPKKTSQLMKSEYSLDSMVNAEFMEGMPLDQLGEELARVMGEREPETILKIVNAIGGDIAVKLFNETKEIEKNGGMNTADGSRRRTPGGVFITLFKMDPDVTRDVKNSIFGDMKNAEKHRVKSRKRAHNFNRRLEDMKKTMDLAKEEELKQDDDAEEPDTKPTVPPPSSCFDDNVVDMV